MTNKNKPKNIAIIFAGGTGQRFGSEIPKQFVMVYGKEIIVHTLERFQKHPEIDEIYVGSIGEWIPFLTDLIQQYNITKVKSVVPGGETGQDTIFNVLSEARKYNSGDSIVLIHDGVRPIVTDREISENIEKAKQETIIVNDNIFRCAGAVTCIPFAETPVFSYDGESINTTMNRANIFRGVAPQSFRLDHILEAHYKIRAIDPGYAGKYKGGSIVDSASLVKAAFPDETCAIVKGNPHNIKVTNTGDFHALLGYLQESDIANYYYGLTNPSYELTPAMVEANRLASINEENEKKKEQEKQQENPKVKTLRKTIVRGIVEVIHNDNK